MKFLYTLAKRFIAGHDFDSAKPVIAGLMEQGYGVTIDYLGELSTTIDDCEKAAEQYLEIIRYYKNSPIDISIKPTQLGLKLNKEKAYELLSKIAHEAERYGVTIRLDMEDSSETQDTIDLCLRVKKVGIALQSNLYRTAIDLPEVLTADPTVHFIDSAVLSPIDNL